MNYPWDRATCRVRCVRNSMRPEALKRRCVRKYDNCEGFVWCSPSDLQRRRLEDGRATSSEAADKAGFTFAIGLAVGMENFVEPDRRLIQDIRFGP
jgi:hypothetical protein